MRAHLRGNHSVNPKKKSVAMHRGILILCSTLFLFGGGMYFGMSHVSAKEAAPQQISSTSEICYTSRLIEPGDSLWSIAEETMTEQYNSVSEYIVALKAMNHLESDTIHAGQYLMIPYEKQAN